MKPHENANSTTGRATKKFSHSVAVPAHKNPEKNGGGGDFEVIFQYKGIQVYPTNFMSFYFC